MLFIIPHHHLLAAFSYQVILKFLRLVTIIFMKLKNWTTTVRIHSEDHGDRASAILLPKTLDLPVTL